MGFHAKGIVRHLNLLNKCNFDGISVVYEPWQYIFLYQKHGKIPIRLFNKSGPFNKFLFNDVLLNPRFIHISHLVVWYIVSDICQSFRVLFCFLACPLLMYSLFVYILLPRMNLARTFSLMSINAHKPNFGCCLEKGGHSSTIQSMVFQTVVRSGGESGGNLEFCWGEFFNGQWEPEEE